MYIFIFHGKVIFSELLSYISQLLTVFWKFLFCIVLFFHEILYCVPVLLKKLLWEAWNKNWETLTKNLVTFKRWDGVKDEKF